MDEQNKTLSWFKWQTRDIKSYREVFTNEQMGELFFAVMETAESGEKVNVSAAIRLAYLQMCNDIEVARAAYIKKCEQNAKNGAKGGRAKAENTKDKSGFKPPTKTEFRGMAKHIRNKYNYCDDDGSSNYNIDCIFEKFSETKWEIKGEPIKDKKMLEALTYAKMSCSIGLAHEIISAFLTLNEDFCADDIENLFDCYQSETKEFIIGSSCFNSVFDAVQEYCDC